MVDKEEQLSNDEISKWKNWNSQEFTVHYKKHQIGQNENIDVTDTKKASDIRTVTANNQKVPDSTIRIKTVKKDFDLTSIDLGKKKLHIEKDNTNNDNKKQKTLWIESKKINNNSKRSNLSLTLDDSMKTNQEYKFITNFHYNFEDKKKKNKRKNSNQKLLFRQPQISREVALNIDTKIIVNADQNLLIPHSFKELSPAKAMVESQSKPTLLSADNKGNIIEWNISDITEETTLEQGHITEIKTHKWEQIHESAIKAICISPDKQFMFTTGSDCTLKQWHIPTKTLHHDWKKIHSFPVYSMVISSDNRYIFTAGKDQSLKKWCIKEKKLKKHFQDIHDDWILCMIESLDGKYLFTSGSDKAQKQFCLTENEQYRDYGEIHDYAVTCQALNNEHLFTGSDDLSIKQWRIDEGKLMFTKHDVHDDCIKCMVINKNWLITGSDDMSVKIWDIANGEAEGISLIKSLNDVHKDWIRTICISENGKFLFTGSEDQTIKYLKLGENGMGKVMDLFEKIHDAGISTLISY